MDDRIIREPERRKLTGVPLSTWKRYQKKNLVPQSVPLLGSTKGYYFSEIQNWIESRNPNEQK